MRKQPLITTAQAADLLNVTQRRIQQWIAAGALPAQRITTRFYMVDRDDLEKIERHKRGRKKAT